MNTQTQDNITNEIEKTNAVRDNEILHHFGITFEDSQGQKWQAFSDGFEGNPKTMELEIYLWEHAERVR